MFVSITTSRIYVQDVMLLKHIAQFGSSSILLAYLIAIGVMILFSPKCSRRVTLGKTGL